MSERIIETLFTVCSLAKGYSPKRQRWPELISGLERVGPAKTDPSGIGLNNCLGYVWFCMNTRSCHSCETKFGFHSELTLPRQPEAAAAQDRGAAKLEGSGPILAVKRAQVRINPVTKTWRSLASKSCLSPLEQQATKQGWYFCTFGCSDSFNCKSRLKLKATSINLPYLGQAAVAALRCLPASRVLGEVMNRTPGNPCVQST